MGEAFLQQGELVRFEPLRHLVVRHVPVLVSSSLGSISVRYSGSDFLSLFIHMSMAPSDFARRS